jgi:predicted nucleic acid-binding protein
MARRVLDTNILAGYWSLRRKGLPHAEIGDEQARSWGRDLVRSQGTNAILTPIYVEYVAGQSNARAVELARVYLGEFERLDRGRITEQDWEQAIQVAQRVLPDGSRRQLGDCLIRALCKRLHLDVATGDRRFPR